MRKNPTSLILGLITVLLAGVAFFSFQSRGRESSETLYRRAMGLEGTGTDQAIAAVRRLASRGDDESSRFLMEIALGDHAFVLPEVRNEAIALLGRTASSGVADAIAAQLQPYQTLGKRKALAQALVGISCQDLCLRFVLHYLERASRGEPNFEDRIETQDRELREFLDLGQHEVIKTLHDVLSRNSKGTLNVLVDVYGLGSENPSMFALDLVSRIELREACPVLEETIRRLRQSPIPDYQAPLLEVRKTIMVLNCPQNP